MPSADQHVAMPPAPPGETSPIAVKKTRAVAAAMTQLGEPADPKRIAEAVKAQAGLDLDPGEVAEIIRELESRAMPPPADQPPPENARRGTDHAE